MKTIKLRSFPTRSFATVLAVPLLWLAGAGQLHAQSGTVYAWGYNGDGELGNGTTTDSTTPVAVSSVNGGFTNAGVSAIAAGGSHGLALQSGTVYAWGYNDDGELGNGTTTQSTTPVAVSSVNGGFTNAGVSAIAGGGYHSLALQNGAVYAWGYNSRGQLGNGTTTDSTTPVAVSSVNGGFTNAGVSAIAGGGYHSLALQSGTVYAWGYNAFGQLGNGTTTDSSTPVAVSVNGGFTNTGVSAIAGGGYHSLALQSGAVYAWGYNSNGQLGNGATTDSSTPVAVSSVNGGFTNAGVSAIAGGGYHSLALQNGAVYAWGYNGHGQLGNGTTLDSSTPIQLSLSNITAVAATGYSSFALASDGSLYVWGDNSSGELGDGTTTNQLTPEHLLPPDGYLYTALDGDAFGDHVVAILSPASVPEPATWITMLGGLGLLGCVQRFRRARKA